MLEGQDVAEPRVMIESGDGTPIPRLSKIKPGAMLASTGAVARVTRSAFESVSISENVEPGGDPDALA